MGYKTANSLEKEITFFVKVRNYLECIAPKWQDTGFSGDGLLNETAPMWRPNDTMQIWEEYDSEWNNVAIHPAPPGSTWGPSYGNRINNLVNFGTTVRDWTNSYDNQGVWTVHKTGKFKIDIDLRFSHAISTVKDYLKNDAWVKNNGGISGYMTLYKLPASSTQTISNGSRILNTGSSPYITSNMPGIQNLGRTNFGIIYNQDGGGGSHFQNANGDAGSRGSGTGTMPAKEPPGWGGIHVMCPKTCFTFPTQMKVLYYENYQFQKFYKPTHHYGLGWDGEFYSNVGHYWSLENPVSLGNKINKVLSVKPANDNKYEINIPNITLDQGDRLFVVVSALFAQFDNNVNGMGGGIDIDNDDRPGGILYQWKGGFGSGNKPSPAIAYLSLQSGSFNAKSIL